MKSLEQFLEATAIAPKDVKSVADKSASSDKMAQKLTQIQQRRQNQRIKQGKVSAPAQTRAGKALPPDKPGGSLATTPSKALAKTKSSGTTSSAGNLNFKKDRTPSKGYMSSPDGPEPYRRSKDVVKKPTKMGPYEKEMEKIRARGDSEKESKGQKFKNFVGKTAKGAVGLAGKALKRASETKMGQTGIESGGSAGSYQTKDTQV